MGEDTPPLEATLNVGAAADQFAALPGRIDTSTIARHTGQVDTRRQVEIGMSRTG